MAFQQRKMPPCAVHSPQTRLARSRGTLFSAYHRASTYCLKGSMGKMVFTFASGHCTKLGSPNSPNGTGIVQKNVRICEGCVGCDKWDLLQFGILQFIFLNRWLPRSARHGDTWRHCISMGQQALGAQMSNGLPDAARPMES